jgi:pimeloyl-ACP methyl ester carboxylesterase
MFRALKKDVTRLGEMGLVGGHVTRPGDDRAPIVVALVSGTPGSVVDTFELDDPGAYFFVVPAGTYRIAAFVDANRDGVYQPGSEPAVQYGQPDEVRLAPGEQRSGVDLHFDSAAHVSLPFAVTAHALGARGTKELPPIHVGEIVTMNDPRFSDENGYFLEPYDPKKTPVLFVHGAGGHPGEFRYLVEHLDRTKFQPWLAFYPSGLHLDLVARGMTRWLDALVARHDIPRIVIVAHSMGGLVSRAAINRMTAAGDGGLLALFVTISTPWNGHSAAARGVEQAPVVMPMWVDVAPGSPFLKTLFETPLPPTCPHHLLFSYKGKSSLVVEEPNDGTAAVSSELAWPAQQGARKVYGFDQSHTGILSSALVSTTLNTLLGDAVR